MLLQYISFRVGHLQGGHLQGIYLYIYKCTINAVKKVNQSHYRPGQAQRVLRNLRFPDFVTTAQGGGKDVSLTHRPSLLPPGNTAGTHFC